LVKKLAIITTHPVQYNAPFFKLLSGSKIVKSKVFYTWGDSVTQSKFDPGFQRTINWDIPLLEGYEYEFLENTSTKKGSHHFKGIVNPQIIDRVNEWKPDAVLVFGWKFSSHLKVIRHFKSKIPVWFRGDSTLLDEKRNITDFLKTLLLKRVYKQIDIAFYTGTNNKQYFLKYGMQPSQLVRACHAIDNDRFFNCSQYSDAAHAWKARLAIKAADFVFLYAGKLESKKNVGSLLKAFTALDKPDVHLIIAGNGYEESNLKKDYVGKKNLHFIDFQNQQIMPVVYQLCDVFVLPSIGPDETWGLSINEAMAAGKAIIASDKCGGAIDLVSNGENGYIFKGGDVQDLFSKMHKLTDAGEGLKVMKANSVKAIHKFTFAEFVGAIENLFEKSDV